MATKKMTNGTGLKRAVRGARKAGAKSGKTMNITRRGSLNETTVKMREYILQAGNPVDFLLGVMRGEPFPQPESRRDPETGKLPVIYPEGDQRMDAAKQLLPRVMPTLKPVGGSLVLNLNAIKEPADILVAINSVIEAMNSGELHPDDAGTIIQVIEKAREALATDELAKEVESLKEMVSELGDG